jgi:TonB family protein
VRALSIIEKTHGSEGLAVGLELDKLGNVYLAQGDIARARTAYMRARPILLEKLQNNSAYGLFLTHLGKLRLLTGQTEEAKGTVDQALTACGKELFKADHNWTEGNRMLGLLFLGLGKYREAEEQLIYALTVRSEALDFENRDAALLYMASASNSLGEFYVTVGLDDKAEPLLLDALGAYEKKYGNDHPLSEDVLVNLAAVYEGKGDASKARQYAERAQALHRRSAGYSHVPEWPVRTLVRATPPPDTRGGPDVRAGIEAHSFKNYLSHIARPAEDGVYKVGSGVSAPAVIYKKDPDYSEEARKAHFSGGVVALQLVVGADGLAHDIKVTRPLGLGLDEKAVEAVSVWRFRPGVKQGNPVAVMATIEVNYRLFLNPPAQPDHSVWQISRLVFDSAATTRPVLTQFHLPDGPSPDGDVRIPFKLNVDKSGHVTDVSTEGASDPVLTAPLQEAVRKWKFDVPPQSNATSFSATLDLTHGNPLPGWSPPSRAEEVRAEPKSAEEAYREGVRLTRAGAPQQAIPLLTRVIQERPDWEAAYSARAQALLQHEALSRSGGRFDGGHPSEPESSLSL